MDSRPTLLSTRNNLTLAAVACVAAALLIHNKNSSERIDPLPSGGASDIALTDVSFHPPAKAIAKSAVQKAFDAELDHWVNDQEIREESMQESLLESAQPFYDELNQKGLLQYIPQDDFHTAYSQIKAWVDADDEQRKDSDFRQESIRALETALVYTSLVNKTKHAIDAADTSRIITRERFDQLIAMGLTDEAIQEADKLTELRERVENASFKIYELANQGTITHDKKFQLLDRLQENPEDTLLKVDELPEPMKAQ